MAEERKTRLEQIQVTPSVMFVSLFKDFDGRNPGNPTMLWDTLFWQTVSSFEIRLCFSVSPV